MPTIMMIVPLTPTTLLQMNAVVVEEVKSSALMGSPVIVASESRPSHSIVYVPSIKPSR